MLQNKKSKLKNKIFKSRTSTTVKAFNEALASGDQESIKTTLSASFSMMDKAVKRGIFKKNKAARLKSRMQAKVATK